MSSLRIAILLIIITICQSLHIISNHDNYIDIQVELDVGKDTTTLMLRCEIPNVWFGIAFDQTSHSPTTMAVIYNANNSQQLNDVLISDTYTTPILLPSKWTLNNVIQYNDATTIHLSRPNSIASDSRYPNFDICGEYEELNAIWAHGDSSLYCEHNPYNRISAKLRRQGAPTPIPTPLPTPSPISPPVNLDYDDTSPSCANYDGDSCLSLSQTKDCCQGRDDCLWQDTYDCNYGTGNDCCIAIMTESPTIQPTECPDSSDEDDCGYFEYECCIADTECRWKQSDLCLQQKSGYNCCEFKTISPTISPTPELSTESPTNNPSDEPTQDPTALPSIIPTINPTMKPSVNPTAIPSMIPTIDPTYKPSIVPTNDPTNLPTYTPTTEPTPTPTLSPTCPRDPNDSDDGDLCSGYSKKCCPTDSGECQWRNTQECNANQGEECCYSVTSNPTFDPTSQPSTQPTYKPSAIPTSDPTEYPTIQPTSDPTAKPTNPPTCPDIDSSDDDGGDGCSGFSMECCPVTNGKCNYKQTDFCLQEGGPDCCYLITESPTDIPTYLPTSDPTAKPTTTQPTYKPSARPTSDPTEYPTINPTNDPTAKPTEPPTCPDIDSSDDGIDGCFGLSMECCPVSNGKCNYKQSDLCVQEGGPNCCYPITDSPTEIPTYLPTSDPTSKPTTQPTFKPSARPTTEPTVDPTEYPSTYPTSDPTPKPTHPPTCPDPDSSDDDDEIDGCFGLSMECCPVANGKCKYKQTDICLQEGGPNCCYQITNSPTELPTPNPTTHPTKKPSLKPTPSPSSKPTSDPTTIPTYLPTSDPTKRPTRSPTKGPTPIPTTKPTGNPSMSPTIIPTIEPTTRIPTPRPTSRRDAIAIEEEPCECDGGITNLNLRYIGEDTARKIYVYSTDGDTERNICKFKYVQNGQELSCDVTRKNGKYFTNNIFPDVTYFKIKYTQKLSGSYDRRRLQSSSGSGVIALKQECAASIDTSCNRDIVGDIDEECGDLLVIGWTDVERDTCDEDTSFNNKELEDEDAFISGHNENEDILVKGLMIAAGLFSIAGIFFVVKCLRKMDKWYYKSRSRRNTDQFETTSMVRECQDRERRITVDEINGTVMEVYDNDTDDDGEGIDVLDDDVDVDVGVDVDVDIVRPTSMGITNDDDEGTDGEEGGDDDTDGEDDYYTDGESYIGALDGNNNKLSTESTGIDMTASYSVHNYIR